MTLDADQYFLYTCYKDSSYETGDDIDIIIDFLYRLTSSSSYS